MKCILGIKLNVLKNPPSAAGSQIVELLDKCESNKNTWSLTVGGGQLAPEKEFGGNTSLEDV